MHFVFTEEQTMIAETAQAFFRENATSERTRAAMAGDGVDRQLMQDFCAELGLGGVIVPEELGGVGLGYVEMAIVAEAAGSTVAAMPLLGLNICAAMLTAGGSEAQKATILPAIK